MKQQVKTATFALVLLAGAAIYGSNSSPNSNPSSTASSPAKQLRGGMLKPLLHRSGSNSPTAATTNVAVPNAGWAFSPISHHRGINTASPTNSGGSPNKTPKTLPKLFPYNSAPTVTATPLPAIASATSSGLSARPTTAVTADLNSLPAPTLSFNDPEARVKMLEIENAQLREENNQLKAHLDSQNNRIHALATEFEKYKALLAAAYKREDDQNARKVERARLKALKAEQTAAAIANLSSITLPAPTLVKEYL